MEPLTSMGPGIRMSGPGRPSAIAVRPIDGPSHDPRLQLLIKFKTSRNGQPRFFIKECVVSQGPVHCDGFSVSNALIAATRVASDEIDQEELKRRCPRSGVEAARFLTQSFVPRNVR